MADPVLTPIELILPAIGSSGYFHLSAPFDSMMAPNERSTCQAVRRLSDYLANNEDPKADVYKAAGLTDADYENDLAVDMYIISLQSQIGHWVYVPAKYLVSYPIVNGIPYRTCMLGISLPALPVDRRLNFLATDISNLVVEALGVSPVIKLVETSRVILVDKSVSDIAEASRKAVSSGRVTDRSRYISLQQDHQDALNKIAALEAFIEAHKTQLGM